MKEVTLESQVGMLKLERAYYYCSPCRQGFFPLDQQLALHEKHWSEGVIKLAVWLSGIVDLEGRRDSRAGGTEISISDSSVWRRTQVWGESFRAIAETERIKANVLPGIWGGPSRAVEPEGRMGVSMDGANIHIRDEGWKELKVGSVFDVEVRPTLDRETGDRIELAHAVNNSYVAHLGGPKIFGQMVWAEAQRRGREGAADTEAVGDDAPWIWNLTAEHFYDSHQVVDWYHGMEHLHTASRLLKGEGTLRTKRWLNDRETRLFEGHAGRIARELAAAACKQPDVAKELEREAGYFRKNQRRMKYQEMREDGWAIGSGMVESADKQFKARFTGSGMRWSRAGAERLLPIRAAVMGSRFDELWQPAYNSPQN